MNTFKESTNHLNQLFDEFITSAKQSPRSGSLENQTVKHSEKKKLGINLRKELTVFEKTFVTIKKEILQTYTTERVPTEGSIPAVAREALIIQSSSPTDLPAERLERVQTDSDKQLPVLVSEVVEQTDSTSQSDVKKTRKSRKKD